MSTNDTLRLLRDLKFLLEQPRTKIDNRLLMIDWIERTIAALAEPVAGEVVPKVLSDAIKSITLCSDCRLDQVCCRPLLRAAHDYIDTNKQAALNGGAVAGQADAARDVLAERQRQISAEGWTPEHDDEHSNRSLAAAASCYALRAGSACSSDPSVQPPPYWWPWRATWWKPGTPRRNLIKAGALILAEIERIDRAALAKAEPCTACRQGRDACTCKGGE